MAEALEAYRRGEPIDIMILETCRALHGRACGPAGCVTAACRAWLDLSSFGSFEFEPPGAAVDGDTAADPELQAAAAERHREQLEVRESVTCSEGHIACKRACIC